ncbi:hypothetical protein Psal071_01639 [Piscirickettsia salmonis]|uniref:Uncharacterized protein n=1 Tax=Piscirickettsia salmonis TaxID=1238 RepID=A0A9Q6PTW9_PISSA|nr:hypothetical protein KW89_1562 [Piscirickettsia salmonis]QGN76569.1 hypothetical protein Psal001_00753 [Piscirickettsia salmonis]QGN77306.1 hypothetical protein Psal001_01512 [Piscirickettsia salmonis]QGN80159.1 hypothetical protein Psal002_00778 [Piscirickettsia salmonis]QGN80891.1 hypothetical protein Psal002_01532 [Piscirickettsia salmonis]
MNKELLDIYSDYLISQNHRCEPWSAKHGVSRPR